VAVRTAARVSELPVAAPNGQQSAPNGKGNVSAIAETSSPGVCADCGCPIEGKRRGARFCSARCRNRYQGAAHRRRVFDAEAVIHPDRDERPFDTYLGDEPDWLRDELAPPALACETAG
jgi:hypothetical protein